MINHDGRYWRQKYIIFWDSRIYAWSIMVCCILLESLCSSLNMHDLRDLPQHWYLELPIVQRCCDFVVFQFFWLFHEYQDVGEENEFDIIFFQSHTYSWPTFNVVFGTQLPSFISYIPWDSLVLKTQRAPVMSRIHRGELIWKGISLSVDSAPSYNQSCSIYNSVTSYS